jgi:ketosteroid isomerase-like protein
VSQQAVEIVRRVVSALNAHDLEGYLACCTEDVEPHLPVVAGVYEGRDGIKRWFADIEDAGPRSAAIRSWLSSAALRRDARAASG